MNQKTREQQHAEDEAFLLEQLAADNPLALFETERGLAICDRISEDFCRSALFAFSFSFQDEIKAKYSKEIRADLFHQGARLYERAAQMKLVLMLIRASSDKSLAEEHMELFTRYYLDVYTSDTALRNLAKTMMYELEKEKKP